MTIHTRLQCATFPLKPLALHEKVATAIRFEKRAVTSLKISGDFSLPDIHQVTRSAMLSFMGRSLSSNFLWFRRWPINFYQSHSFVDFSSSHSQWASNVLPELPPRLTSEEARFDFHSTFLGTSLTAEYKRGFATFVSDNCSTIAIVKEVLSREATAAKAQISISIDCSDESVAQLLLALRPKLDAQFTLARRHGMIEAVKEIAMAEGGDVSFLEPELREILSGADAIERQQREAPRHLDFLRALVSELLGDWHRLRGKGVGGKQQQLEQLLGGGGGSVSAAGAGASAGAGAGSAGAYSFEAVMSVFGLAMPAK